MNRDQLSLILNEHFRPETYSLDGGLPNERLCLERRSDGWAVYYSERGIRTSEVAFLHESDACIYMLDVMEQQPYMHRAEPYGGK